MRRFRKHIAVILCLVTVFCVWMYAHEFSQSKAQYYTVLLVDRPSHAARPSPSPSPTSPSTPGTKAPCIKCKTSGLATTKRPTARPAAAAIRKPGAQLIRNVTETPVVNEYFDTELNSSVAPFNGSDVSTTPAPVLSSAHILMVVSYMRSGSSFTADILQHFPQTIYVFEPLHRVIWRIGHNLPLHYVNGTVKEITDEIRGDAFLKEELHKWLQCRLDELDVHTLFDDFHNTFSRSMRRLHACWKPLGAKLSSLRQCLPKIIQFCKRAKMRLFKFIRLPMRIVEQVFDMYPNMQVLHLLRDPRGTIASQLKLKGARSNVYNASKNHCSAVEEDLEVTSYLHENFPSRIKILVYESLAKDPNAVAKRMYRFAGVPPYIQILHYIRRLTFSNKSIKCSYCIIKTNSTAAALKWKENITLPTMQTIDSVCKNVYDHIGFNSFKSVKELQAQDTWTSRNVSLFV